MRIQSLHVSSRWLCVSIYVIIRIVLTSEQGPYGVLSFVERLSSQNVLELHVHVQVGTLKSVLCC